MFRLFPVTHAGKPTLTFLAVATLILVLPLCSQAQRPRDTGTKGDDEPAFHEFKGVSLGMTADESRKKLGAPKDKSDAEDFYMFGENLFARVLYKTNKVVTISLDFMNAVKEAPTAKEVLGSDVQPNPDGSINKTVRYPKAGYWVTYSRTAGDSPTVSVTMQKIDQY